MHYWQVCQFFLTLPLNFHQFLVLIFIHLFTLMKTNPWPFCVNSYYSFTVGVSRSLNFDMIVIPHIFLIENITNAHSKISISVVLCENSSSKQSRWYFNNSWMKNSSPSGTSLQTIKITLLLECIRHKISKIILFFLVVLHRGPLPHSLSTRNSFFCAYTWVSNFTGL